uniref:DNA helicase n=1 Tax=Tanacetum cinerariifolium TaxID=118510 RepID=A0A6L2JI61_TANCI|nr:DNA helicase [Tanacetum cinerariifolium]
MRLLRLDITDDERNKTQCFSSWLLDIDDGNIGDADEIDVDNSSTVEIPNELCIQDDDTAIIDLISFIYDTQTFERHTAEHLQKKVIVCQKNKTTDIINRQVLSALNEREHVYLSSDDATPHGNDGGETELLYPNEYLNSLNFVGLPPHGLELNGFNLPFLIWDETAEKFDMNEYAQMPKPVVITVSSTWATTKYRDMPSSSTQLNHTKYKANHVAQMKKKKCGTAIVYNHFSMSTHNIIRKCTSCNKKVPEETSACSDHGLQPVNYGYCFRIIIDDDTGIATITCFSPEEHTFTPNCNELVNTVENKDTRSLPNALKALKNATYIFQYRFGQKAKLGRPNFSLDVVFNASPQPLLRLPLSPLQELLEQKIFCRHTTAN